MNRPARTFFWSLTASCILSLTAFGQSPVEDKYRTEQRMAAGLSAILDKFLGPNMFHVTVVLDVEVQELSPSGGLRDAVVDPAVSNSASVKTQWLWKDYMRKPKASILPGFLQGGELRSAENKDKEAKRDPVSELQENTPVYALAIKRHLVSVILDGSVSEKYKKLAEMMISETLGLDPERGDKINLYHLPMLSTWKWALLKPETVQDVFWLILSACMAALLIWMLKNSVLSARRGWGIFSVKKADAAAPVLAAPPAAGPTSDSFPLSTAQACWDFISPDNIGMLTELLEKADPSEAATVLGSIEPGMASQTLEHLPEPVREAVLLRLSQPATPDPGDLIALNARWKERLDHSFGGVDALGALLGLMEPPLQDAFVNRLIAVSPETARRVRTRIIRFEHVFHLNDAHLASLLKEVSFSDWSQALVGMPEPAAARLLRLLPAETRKVLQDWFDLRPSQAGIKTKQSRIKILQSYRDLARKGQITPGSGSAHPKAVPPATPMAKLPGCVQKGG